MFESFRIIAVIVTMGSRLIFTPWYLQAYLDMAYHRIELQKKEAGRITNVDLQKKVPPDEFLLNLKAPCVSLIVLDCCCFLLPLRCNCAICSSYSHLLVPDNHV